MKNSFVVLLVCVLAAFSSFRAQAANGSAAQTDYSRITGHNPGKRSHHRGIHLFHRHRHEKDHVRSNQYSHHGRHDEKRSDSNERFAPHSKKSPHK